MCSIFFKFSDLDHLWVIPIPLLLLFCIQSLNFVPILFNDIMLGSFFDLLAHVVNITPCIALISKGILNVFPYPWVSLDSLFDDPHTDFCRLNRLNKLLGETSFDAVLTQG